MPNIEIYGIPGVDIVPIKEVERAIQSIGLENEAVVTVVHDSMVTSCDGKRTSMPFIRVCSTEVEKEKIERIVEALKKVKIGLDIETLILNSFIPKDEMK